MEERRNRVHHGGEAVAGGRKSMVAGGKAGRWHRINTPEAERTGEVRL